MAINAYIEESAIPPVPSGKVAVSMGSKPYMKDAKTLISNDDGYLMLNKNGYWEAFEYQDK